MRTEQNFQDALILFDAAESGSILDVFVGNGKFTDLDVEYEKLNLLITGLRTIVNMDVHFPGEILKDETELVVAMKARARYILRSIGA